MPGGAGFLPSTVSLNFVHAWCPPFWVLCEHSMYICVLLMWGPMSVHKLIDYSPRNQQTKIGLHYKCPEFCEMVSLQKG